MGYRIDPSASLGSSLRRCGAERLEHALAQLGEGLDADPQGAVHEARKDVKKTRALLRMSREALGGATHRRENGELRDAGRELSSIRDADVMAETIDALAERYAGQVPAAAFDGLRAELDGDGQPSPEDAAAAARDRLAPVLGRVEDWPLERADPRVLRKALRRTYARGRRAFERSERAPSDERLHTWRKRVKDLRYQQQLLRPAWPGVIGAQAKAAKKLSDLLGDDHDLAVLQGRAGASPEVAELIVRRRGELQEEAFRLGRLVYAESPKRFARRVGRYLSATLSHARAETTA